jgi:hypothetical protein
MSSYRFYSHDHLGRLIDRCERQCRDDGEALEVAHGLNHRHDIEVWLGLRHVARIPKRTSTAEVAVDLADVEVLPVLHKARHG